VLVCVLRHEHLRRSLLYTPPLLSPWLGRCRFKRACAGPIAGPALRVRGSSSSGSLRSRRQPPTILPARHGGFRSSYGGSDGCSSGRLAWVHPTPLPPTHPTPTPPHPFPSDSGPSILLLRRCEVVPVPLPLIFVGHVAADAALGESPRASESRSLPALRRAPARRRAPIAAVRRRAYARGAPAPPGLRLRVRPRVAAGDRLLGRVGPKTIRVRLLAAAGGPNYRLGLRQPGQRPLTTRPHSSSRTGGFGRPGGRAGRTSARARASSQPVRVGRKWPRAGPPDQGPLRRCSESCATKPSRLSRH
jgi:hypothetical protein